MNSMMAMPLDTLQLANELKAAGFSSRQAEAVTRAIKQGHEVDLSHLATKQDLQAVKQELKSDIAGIRADMQILKRDVTIRLGGLIMLPTGVLLAAKFFG
jgi:hypothetical protein